MRTRLPIVIDQAASSINVLLFVVASATVASAEEFGLLGVSVGFMAIGLGLTRPWGGELLLVRQPSGKESGRGPTVRSLITMSFVASLIVAVLTSLLIWIFQREAPATAAWVVAASFPLIALVDAYRLKSISDNHAWRAVAASCSWLSVFTAGWIMLLFLGRESTVTVSVTWIAPPALIALSWIATARPRLLRSAWEEYRPYVGYSYRYSLDYLLMAGAAQAALMMVTAVAGLKDAAGLRGAQALVGPLNVGLAAVAMLILAQQRTSSNPAIPFRRAKGLAALLMLLVVAATFVLVLIPDGLGERILGDSWRQASYFLPPVGIATAMSGAALVATTYLRSANEPRLALRTRLIVAPLTLTGVLGAALIDGPLTAVWAFAAFSALSAVAWFYTLNLMRDRVNFSNDRRES